jgi:hypothetical protein
MFMISADISVFTETARTLVETADRAIQAAGATEAAARSPVIA